MSVVEAPAQSVINTLQSIVGSEHVLTDAHNCSLYAQDIRSKQLPAMAVVQPDNTEQLAKVVAAGVAAGHAVIARGGGMSYTSGYVPTEADSIIIDMARMNRVLEINRDDMYVRVECGCTWVDLHEALNGSGLRTPFWGTLSGIRATIGGGMSQNAIFWGSGQHGTAVDSLLSLEVVIADGSVIHTGADAQAKGSPFFRHYGPDLTGLFSCDTGALGFKATATLRLIPEQPERRPAAFDFSDSDSLIGAMSEIGRAGLAAECFAFDPELQRVRMQRESLMTDVKRLAGVMRSGDSVLGALKDGAKLALAGRGYMKDVDYSLNVMIEERVAATADAALAEVNAICHRHGGKSIEPSIPKILRANPFTPLNNIVGPQGERWTPIHTNVPHSKAKLTYDRIEAVFEQHRELIEQHQITVGFLLAAVSTNGFIIEPVFFTPDAMTEIHREVVEPQIMKKLPGFADNAEARAATDLLRHALIEVFQDVGGIHMQIGKSYPYRQGLRPESWQLVEQIKQLVDPTHRINPGSLGLD